MQAGAGVATGFRDLKQAELMEEANVTSFLLALNPEQFTDPQAREAYLNRMLQAVPDRYKPYVQAYMKGDMTKDQTIAAIADGEVEDPLYGGTTTTQAPTRAQSRQQEPIGSNWMEASGVPPQAPIVPGDPNQSVDPRYQPLVRPRDYSPIPNASFVGDAVAPQVQRTAGIDYGTPRRNRILEGSEVIKPPYDGGALTSRPVQPGRDYGTSRRRAILNPPPRRTEPVAPSTGEVRANKVAALEKQLGTPMGRPDTLDVGIPLDTLDVDVTPGIDYGTPRRDRIISGLDPDLSIKEGVEYRNFTPEMRSAVNKITRQFKDELELDPTLVSGQEGHEEGYHPGGNGADFRLRDVPPSRWEAVTDSVRSILGPEYDVVLEKDPPHIHVERDLGKVKRAKKDQTRFSGRDNIDGGFHHMIVGAPTR
jgi:hypothetical protein